MSRIFWATVPLTMKVPEGSMNTTVGYVLEERSKNIIEFIIDSAALHIKKEMNAKIRLHDGYGYDLKDINIFEDTTTYKCYRLSFLGYIENDKHLPGLACSIELPCSLEFLEKIVRCPGFYADMARQIQERVRGKFNLDDLYVSPEAIEEIKNWEKE